MTEAPATVRRLWWLAALLGLLLGALTLAGTSPPTQARAAAKKPLYVPGAFQLEGSNGYDLYVIGEPAFRKQPASVVIFAYAKGRLAHYRAPATVTEESIQANLGELGEISVSFHRSGRAVSAVCDGREVRFDSGSYEGTISFHGEEGFTSVDATTVPGDIKYAMSYCGAGIFFEETSGRPRGAALYVRNPALGQEMSVRKRRPGAAAELSAWTREYAAGISISREVSLRIPTSAFTYDRHLRTATVRPTSPWFSGSARFDLAKKAGQRWSGDLTVDLPGRSDVPLTGPSLRASLVPDF